MNFKAIAALIFTVVIWGVAPALVRSFSLAAGPWDSMFIRLTSVALICILLLPFSGWYIARKDWARLLIIHWVGVFGYFVGSIFGFAWIAAGPGGLVFASQSLIIAALAAALGVEKLKLATILGFIVSFIGTVYLVSGDLELTGSNPWWGAAFIVGACIAFSINVVLAKPLVQNYGPLRITIVGMILTAIPSAFFYRPESFTILQNLDWKAWAALFYLGPIGTILAVITWNYAVGKMSASTVGGSLYAIPILSIIAGYVLLGEPFGTRTLIAGAIILAGVAISEYGKSMTLSTSAGVLAVLFAVVAWGTIPVAMRFLLEDVTPNTALLLRLYPAGIAAALIAIWFGAPRFSWMEWFRIISAGLAYLILYHVLATYGMAQIPASWTGMLFGLEPIVIALCAVLFLREKLHGAFLIGLALALAGTAILVIGSSTGTVENVSVTGVILVAVSTLGWAIYTTLIRPVSNAHGAVVTACLAVAVVALPTPVLMTATTLSEVHSLSGYQWLAVAHVSIVATTMTTIAWNAGLKHMSNSSAGLFLYLQPLIGAAGGYFLLSENITVWLLAGGALILAGVAVSQYNAYTAESSEDQAEVPYPDEDDALEYRA
jgi:drug/metabolite transporter (DMT)-like permease